MQQMATNIINKKFLAGTVSIILLFTFFILPIFVLATTTPLVPCHDDPNKCNFTAFITMINNIITRIISISVVIFAISAIWGGFLYVTSGVNPGNKDKAKKILWSTLTGFVIILVAWLIVYTIIITLTKEGEQGYILKFLKSVG